MTMDDAATTVVREYIKARPRDFDALTRLRAPGFVEDWPQSGERIRGDANSRALHEQYPGGLPAYATERVSGTPEQWAMTPMFTLVHLTGSGSSFTVEGNLVYPDGSPYKVIAVLEVANSKIASQRTYFAALTEAPAWRAQWVERTS
jgi:hypothetical protein